MQGRNKKVKLLLCVADYYSFLRRKRKYWVHPINIKRDYLGEYTVLCLEFEKYPGNYFKYFKMSKEKFDILLELIARNIEPTMNNFRKPIEAKLKLLLTLR